MSKIKDIFRSVGKFLMQAELPLSAQPVPEPQVGMKWQLEHHHKYNFDDGFVVVKSASFQIVDSDDDFIEIQESGHYRAVFSRDDWAEIYRNNFAGRRDASQTAGKGYIEPVYLGVRALPESQFTYYSPVLADFHGNDLIVKNHGRKSTAPSLSTSLGLMLPVSDNS